MGTVVRTIAFLDRGADADCRRAICSTPLADIRTTASAGGVFADRQAILDGEIVALDDVDRPSFSRLQRRMHLNDAPSISRAVRDIPIFYVIFDLLHLDGRSLMSLARTPCGESCSNRSR